jgi:predicted enzyme related to lactoylglutathione lyase
MDTNTAVPQGSTPRTQPESFRGRSLAASLTVSDLQRSLTFYRDVVGFTVDRKFEREGRLAAVALKAGAVELLLGQDDGAKGEGRVKGEGFSLQITTSQDVDALAKRIKDRGGLLTTEPADVWGARVFRMQDPDGFRLTISSQRS